MSTTATLPVRTTRGKRMKALIGEAEEADNEFWGQDFFAEEGGDIEYEKSDSETSVYDSDFSDQEPDQDDEADAEEEEEDTDKRRKKKLLPPGSRKPKPSQRKSSKSAGAGTSEGSGRQRKGHAHLLLLGETRKSSRASVVEASLRHEAHKRMQEVEQQIRKFKRESSESAGKAKNARVSMYDLLKESCQVTEEINAVSLKHLLEREEEAKRRHSAQSRKVYLGPKVKYHSYKGEDGLARNEYAFLDGAEPPSTSARSCNAPPPPHPKCAITGNVAKYKDPVTGLYYSDAKSFKEVRANKPKQQPNPLIVVGSSKPKAGLLKLKIKPPRLVVKE